MKSDLQTVVRRIPDGRLFATELRKLGFTKNYESIAGGEMCRIYEKQVDDRRKVTVQLWGNAHHRASHYIDDCMSTSPIAFTTVGGMNVAIQKESERMDNRKFQSA